MSYSNGTGASSGAGASASSSRSKRELIDRVRYPNPIPVPPYPPKLVKIPTEPSRYANPHFADRLASQQPIPIVVDVHAGMPIDLANFQNLWEGDLDEVVVPPTAQLDAQDLDDADAFLLQDFASTLPPAASSSPASGAIGLITSLKATDDPATQASLQAAIQQRHTQSLGPGAKATLAADDVTWLRRTEYLSAQQRNAQQQVQKPKVAERIDVSREAQLAKIQKSFTDAQKPLSSLVHPHKKGVKAEQVFDFLPDPETWATDYQVVRFIDHPGRIINGVPQPDPRLDVALFRPVSAADGEQRVSYYLPAGEEIPEDPEAPMTLIDNRDIEENNARRLRKRRRTGKFPVPPEVDDEEPEPKLLKKDYATPFKLSRDYVPKDTTESAHDVLLLTLDDGIPDPDPDADVDPIKGVKSAPSKADDDDDDLFGDDDDADDAEDAAASQVDSTLPPQSQFERQKRSRRSAATKGKERSEQPDGQGITSESCPRARAYYHKVGMRFTLRVWRSRFTNNEKLRNRDRRYPGKWDAIVLSNRELHEREQLRRLHLRSQVDDVGELDPYEEAEEEEEIQDGLAEQGDAEAAANGAADAQQDGTKEREGSVDANGDVDAADPDQDQDDQPDEQADDDASDDDDEEDASDDEDGTVDGDEELAALRAEAGEAGEGLDQGVEGGGRRSRSRRSAAASADDQSEQSRSAAAAAAMDEDDD